LQQVHEKLLTAEARRKLRKTASTFLEEQRKLCASLAPLPTGRQVRVSAV